MNSLRIAPAPLAGVIADYLNDHHDDITFVTPASIVSPWTVHTLEQERVQQALLRRGVDVNANRVLSAIGDGVIETACIYTGRKQTNACASLVLVTERIRETRLFGALSERQDAARGAPPLRTLELIGDAAMPGLIADAVYAGHMAARCFEADATEIEQAWFRRELPSPEP